MDRTHPIWTAQHLQLVGSHFLKSIFIRLRLVWAQQNAQDALEGLRWQIGWTNISRESDDRQLELLML